MEFHEPNHSLTIYLQRCLVQVQGKGEYMQGGSLSDYEYVHHCYKYDRYTGSSVFQSCRISIKIVLYC